MTTFQSQLRKIWFDEVGIVDSVELLAIGTLAIFGLLVGVSAIRDGILSELDDVSRGIQDLHQGYQYGTASSSSATTAGSSYLDREDGEDLPVKSDSCILFDVLPSDEEKVFVQDDNQVLDFQFDSAADDTSPFGSDNSGTLQGGAIVSNGRLILDGQNDRVAISNSNDLNLSTITERTIFIDFIANDVNRRQIIFEEGGNVRGFNIYLHNGMLYLGSYNLAETSYQTFLSAPVSAGQRITAALRLDANNTVQPNALTGFLNGTQFATGSAAQVNRHPGGIRLGGISGNTVLHDGVRQSNQGGNTYFGGAVNAFQIYNRAMSDDEICRLSEHQ